MTAEQRADALRALIKLSPAERLYGIVDGAQDLELAFEAKALYGQNIVSLFQGDMAAAAATVAPYVVPIDPESGYLERWGSRAGRNVGILATVACDQNTLYNHLREVFISRDENGQEYFFRFYDPRVLRSFLPTCQSEELREFFGPIGRLVTDDELSEHYVIYSCSNGILIQDRLNKKLSAMN